MPSSFTAQRLRQQHSRTHCPASYYPFIIPPPLLRFDASHGQQLYRQFVTMSRSEAEKHELDAAELRSLIARDLEASNDLATRITQLRQDISEGKPLPPKKIDIMERSNKDMTKDLMLRIEKMEGAEGLTAIDREMLQALNARLAVCDMQTMRLAELRDLETAARGEKMREFLEVDAEAEAQVPLSPKQEFEAMPVDEDAANLEAHETDQGSSVGRHDNSSDNSDADDTDDSEPDESSWPLLYRIMGVDPSTCPEDIASALSK